MAKMGFNAAEVAPQQPFDVLNKGWYPMVISEAENKEIQKGQRLELVFTVDAGKAKGRKTFDGLNWKHDSSEAQRIGQEQLSAICHAVGVINLENDKQLVGKKLAVKLGIEEERKDEQTGKVYDARNVCKGFKTIEGFEFKDPMEGGAAPASGGTPMGAAAPQDAPDWMKNPAGTPGGAATPTETAPATPAAPAVPATPTAPPAPVVAQKTDEERLTEGGWTQHPQSPEYWYKGQEVLLKADVLGKLAPATPPVPPVASAPAAPAATASAATNAGEATPPAASAAAAGDTPPWLQG
jgi:hypothetical protein